FYNVSARTLYRGDGRQRSAAALGGGLDLVAGARDWTGDYDAFPKAALEAEVDLPYGLDFGPDGSLYYTDLGHRGVFRLDPDGIVHRVAGNGQSCSAYYGDETLADCGVPGPARQARLNYVSDVAVAPDRSEERRVGNECRARARQH